MRVIRQAIGLILAGAPTLSGVGFGAWVAVVASESYLVGFGFGAIPVVAALELIFGGIGLFVGYRAYFAMTQ